MESTSYLNRYADVQVYVSDRFDVDKSLLRKFASSRSHTYLVIVYLPKAKQTQTRSNASAAANNSTTGKSKKNANQVSSSIQSASSHDGDRDEQTHRPSRPPVPSMEILTQDYLTAGFALATYHEVTNSVTVCDLVLRVPTMQQGCMEGELIEALLDRIEDDMANLADGVNIGVTSGSGGNVLGIESDGSGVSGTGSDSGRSCSPKSPKAVASGNNGNHHHVHQNQDSSSFSSSLSSVTTGMTYYDMPFHSLGSNGGNDNTNNTSNNSNNNPSLNSPCNPPSSPSSDAAAASASHNLTRRTRITPKTIWIVMEAALTKWRNQMHRLGFKDVPEISISQSDFQTDSYDRKQSNWQAKLEAAAQVSTLRVRAFNKNKGNVHRSGVNELGDSTGGGGGCGGSDDGEEQAGGKTEWWGEFHARVLDLLACIREESLCMVVTVEELRSFNEKRRMAG
jgi:hypothetical protein